MAEREWVAGRSDFDYLLEFEAKKEMYFDFIKGSYAEFFYQRIKKIISLPCSFNEYMQGPCDYLCACEEGLCVPVNLYFQFRLD